MGKVYVATAFTTAHLDFKWTLDVPPVISGLGVLVFESGNFGSKSGKNHGIVREFRLGDIYMCFFVLDLMIYMRIIIACSIYMQT